VSLCTLYARGLRLTLRVAEGGRLAFSLIRFGPSVPGLGPGALLAAADSLENSIFHR
jgi:hypothetical protein